MPEPAPRCTALTLLVEDLLLSMRIGVSEAERSQPQRVLVTLKAEVEAALPVRDQVVEVLDYGWMAEQVRQLAATEMKLLETLGVAIARRLFAEPRLLSLEVTLRKPDIVEDADAVGVALRFAR